MKIGLRSRRILFELQMGCQVRKMLFLVTLKIRLKISRLTCQLIYYCVSFTPVYVPCGLSMRSPIAVAAVPT